MSPREWTFLNRSPCHSIKKVASLLHFILKWQGMRESNSQQWFWRPLLYHLTNPLDLPKKIEQIDYNTKKHRKQVIYLVGININTRYAVIRRVNGKSVNDLIPAFESLLAKELKNKITLLILFHKDHSLS